MDGYKKDSEHSWHELKAAAVGLFDVTRIKTEGMREYLWEFLPQHLVLQEITFLRDYVQSLPEDVQHDFSTFGLGNFQDLFRELPNHHSIQGNTTLSNLPVPKVLIVGLIASPMFGRFGNRHGMSPRFYNELIANAVERFESVAVISADPITESQVLRIRGEIMEYVMLLTMKEEFNNGPRSQDQEFYEWLATHEDDVYEIYPALKERNSADQSLIRELVGASSKPLLSGTL